MRNGCSYCPANVHFSCHIKILANITINKNFGIQAKN
jgi:hypothetical protein